MQKEVQLRWIFITTLLINAGAAFMWPLTTIYMHQYLGKSLTFSGVVLFLMSIAMIAGNYAGGQLFDRWRPYQTAIVAGLISTITMLVLIFWHSWLPYSIGLIIIGFGDGINMTVINAYAATITSRNNRYVFNMLYTALNVGVVIGTLLVGYLIQAGITVVFMATTVAYIALVLITVLKFNIPISRNRAHASQADQTPRGNRQFIYLICLMIFAVYLSYALWESVLSVHMTNLGIPFRSYSEVWTLNGLLIILGQPLINLLNTRLKISTQIGVGVFLFALSFLGLVFARHYFDFILVMIVLTVGEMLGLAIAPAWVDDLSAPDQRGKYQGRFNMALSLGRAVGPLFGGLVIQLFSYSVLFVTVTILMLFTLVLVLWRARHSRIVSE